MKKLELINPAELTVDTNVRTVADLGADFIDSIKEHGVLQPVTAHRTNDGLHVLMGQRRTLASIEAGIDSIPVYVVDSPEEADRIAQQVIENDMRTELNVANRAEAYHQLSLLGLSPTKIAKRTGTKKEKVETALKATSHEVGQSALGSGVPFDLAAQIIDLEPYPDLVETLTEVALENPASFDHAYKRATSEASLRMQASVIRYELEQEGQTIVEAEAGLRPNELNRPDGTRADETDENAQVILCQSWRDEPMVYGVVTGWEEAGYTKYVYNPNDRQSGPMSTEEKAERKQLIERNKLMDEATEVREKFLVTLLSKKDLPKGFENLVANVLCTQVYEVQRADRGLVCKMLGVTATAYEATDSIRTETGKSAKRAHQVMLATTLATYEKLMVRDCWRNTTTTDGNLRADYLNQLVAWGYNLSEVEKITARISE